MSDYSKRLAVVVTTLNAAFGKPNPPTIPQLEAWRIGLAGVGIDQVGQAARRWLSEKDHMATPAGVRAMAEAGAEEQGLKAWTSLLEAIRRPSRRAEVLGQARVARVVANLGGLEVLCDLGGNDLHVWARQRFLEVWRALGGKVEDGAGHRQLLDHEGVARGAGRDDRGLGRGEHPRGGVSNSVAGLALCEGDFGLPAIREGVPDVLGDPVAKSDRRGVPGDHG